VDENPARVRARPDSVPAAEPADRRRTGHGFTLHDDRVIASRLANSRNARLSAVTSESAQVTVFVSRSRGTATLGVDS